MVEGATSDSGPAKTAVGLLAIFAAFFRLGITSFGGNLAAWIYRDVVLRRRWVDDRAFLTTLALGQAMPGSNGIKTAVLVGQRLYGAAGAAAAVIGMLAGPFLIAIALASFYSGFGRNHLLHAVLDGVAAAAIGLTFATGLRSLAHSAPGPGGVAVAAATMLGVGVMRWPMVPVVLALAPISIALALVQARRR